MLNLGSSYAQFAANVCSGIMLNAAVGVGSQILLHSNSRCFNRPFKIYIYNINFLPLGTCLLLWLFTACRYINTSSND